MHSPLQCTHPYNALTATMRSNLPGRLSAGSNTSARLVAANTMTAVLLSNPSISWGERGMQSRGEQRERILTLAEGQDNEM